MSQNDADAMKWSAIMLISNRICLKLALKLHAALKLISVCSQEQGWWTLVAYRIFTVSNGWVAVTAPQAAIPPARNALAVVNGASFDVCIVLQAISNRNLF
jgi:hypothetical protein